MTNKAAAISAELRMINPHIYQAFQPDNSFLQWSAAHKNNNNKWGDRQESE
jgi:hypothetical protein